MTLSKGNRSVTGVGLIFTSCLFPEFVERAANSVRSYYPDCLGVIVNDLPTADVKILEETAAKCDLVLIHNDQRIGAGRSIDRAVNFLETPFVLTIDHGTEMKKGGLIEIYLEKMGPGIIGVGPKRGGKQSCKAFGYYVDPILALWDREAIVENGLSFKLTQIRIGDWEVGDCSNAQLLFYRALKLGYKPEYISWKLLGEHMDHHRTPRTRGRCASPHELVVIDEDYLLPRRRNKDGSFVV